MRNYDLGNRIYELRRAKGLSQRELGELLGVSNKAVSKWENGAAIPKTDTLVKLAEILGVSPQELLQGKTDNRLTLRRLNTETNLLFLEEELQVRDRALKEQEYIHHKKYLAAVCSVFLSAFAVALILMTVTPDFTEEGMQWYHRLADAVLFGYAVISVFSGIVFLSRLGRKLPLGVIILLGVLFPLTVLLTETVGFGITPVYIVQSIRGIIEVKTHGQNSNSEADSTI